LTRSAIKPRLLFPSDEQKREREQAEAEEALTDIDVEMQDHEVATPEKGNFANGAALNTPPSTRMKRSRKRGGATEMPSAEDEAEDPMNVGTEGEVGEDSEGKKKAKTVFDSWQRTKGGRKRSADAVEEGVGKRTRSSLESPA
jgi:hypothetical protein